MRIVSGSLKFNPGMGKRAEKLTAQNFARVHAANVFILNFYCILQVGVEPFLLFLIWYLICLIQVCFITSMNKISSIMTCCGFNC